MVVVVCFPIGFATAYLVDEVVGLVFDLIDEVLEVACIYAGWTEAYKSSACDTLSHRRLADDEDVLCHHGVPQGEFVFHTLGSE